MKECNHYIIKNGEYIPTIKYLPVKIYSPRDDYKTLEDIKYPSKTCYCTKCGYILHEADYARLINKIKYKNKFINNDIETPLDRAYTNNLDIINMVAPVTGEYFSETDKENLHKDMISPETKYPSFYDNRKCDKQVGYIKDNTVRTDVFNKNLTNVMNEMGNGDRDAINLYQKFDDSNLEYNSCMCDDNCKCSCKD